MQNTFQFPFRKLAFLEICHNLSYTRKISSCSPIYNIFLVRFWYELTTAITSWVQTPFTVEIIWRYSFGYSGELEETSFYFVNQLWKLSNIYFFCTSVLRLSKTRNTVNYVLTTIWLSTGDALINSKCTPGGSEQWRTGADSTRRGKITETQRFKNVK